MSDMNYLWLQAWISCSNIPTIEWILEYNFDAVMNRRHRFDFAALPSKVAVEVDGGVWLPHGGRHGTDIDREKLNIAASLGWLVFRFSPAQLQSDPAGCVALVEDAIRIRGAE